MTRRSVVVHSSSLSHTHVFNGGVTLAGLQEILNVNLDGSFGDSFSVDTQDGQDTYSYIFQVCGDAGGSKGAGVIQKKKDGGKESVVGRYTATQAIGGSE